MQPLPLDYTTPEPTRPGARRAMLLRYRWPVIAVGLLLIAVLVPFVPIRSVHSEIDAVTGTMRWTTEWPLGLRTGPRYDVSALQRRLTTSGIAWTPAWQTLHHTQRNLLGQPHSFACGVAPPIHDIHVALPQFVRSATDEELRAFVTVMQTGTDTQQQSAVDAIQARLLTQP